MKHVLKSAFMLAVSAMALASCSMMEDDLPPCPQGLDIRFKYDYNLERADMFHDHVGGVMVYLYDSEGKFLKKVEEGNTSTSSPLRVTDYALHIDVEPGTYSYQVVAWQKPMADCLATAGAKFRIAEPQPGQGYEPLELTLDRTGQADADGRYLVENQGMPLDTLWRNLGEPRTVEVVKDIVTTDTVNLIRDTKHINVTLRDIEKPDDIDVADFDFKIYDKNGKILWNNDVDESSALTYTPYATWNTEDLVPPAETRCLAAADGDEQPEAPGRIAHADFMTSRLLWHDNGAKDAVLSVTNKTTGHEVIRVNLADLISRLRTSADRIYSRQEFLDRGYDYRLSFFLQGDRWKYVNVEISTLSWAKRVQLEELGN